MVKSRSISASGILEMLKSRSISASDNGRTLKSRSISATAGIKVVFYPKIQNLENCGVSGYFRNSPLESMPYKLVRCTKYPAIPHIWGMLQVFDSISFFDRIFDRFFRFQKNNCQNFFYAVFCSVAVVFTRCYSVQQLAYSLCYLCFIRGIGVNIYKENKKQGVTNTPHLGYLGVLRGIPKSKIIEA